MWGLKCSCTTVAGLWDAAGVVCLCNRVETDCCRMNNMCIYIYINEFVRAAEKKGVRVVFCS